MCRGRRDGRGEDNRPVNAIDRPLPPLNADERATLEGWLDFHRVTLAMKCEGLDDGLARTLESFRDQVR